MKRQIFQTALILLMPYILQATDHLLISEIVLQPSAGEYVLITNPSSSDINLGNYYLTDATDIANGKYYYNLPSGVDYWSSSPTDFIARFPDTTLTGGASLILSMARNSDYEITYGTRPDLALKDNMLNAVDGQTTIGGSPNVKLDNTAESLILFYWDGTSATVKDVEYLVWGTDSGTASNYMIDKSAVAGYLADTPVASQSFMATHLDGSKLIRNGDEGTETTTGGNGITGHDETSENLATTWSVVDLTIDKPEIANIIITPDDPEISEDMIVTAEVTDASGISSVVLTYTFPSDTGTPTDLVMTNTSGDVWTATIPATGTEGELGYFITAINTSGLSETSPVKGVDVADPPPPVTIQTIWEDFNSYNDQVMTLTGVIAIGSGITRTDRTEAYFQDYSGYGLVLSASGTLSPALINGDSISITGMISEYNGTKQIQDFSTTIIATGRPVPNVTKISTADLNSLAFEDRFVEINGVVSTVAYDIGGGTNAVIEDITGEIVSEKDKQVTLRIWDSTFLLSDSVANSLLQPGSYVTVRGLAGQYNSEGQLVVAYASDVQPYQEGEPGDGGTVLNVAPYPFDPLRGEKIQYTFSFPANSHIVVRVFDLSGRFITTLFDGYRTPALEITNYWKGRTETYKLVPPGTYIMHLETINRISGETLRDIAPVVVASRIN
ncbi:MAG: lamin tail domain-containing protein [Candidatus Marinimicrobia bacterium]|nr:lamin tail domain-containing protein [Candidatus Neomarinimicrobiota bacterium]